MKKRGFRIVRKKRDVPVHMLDGHVFELINRQRGTTKAGRDLFKNFFVEE